MILVTHVPHFGAIALSVLPRFLEAVPDSLGLGPSRLVRMEFNPDREGEREDPPRAFASFFFTNNYQVVFKFIYRAGEEGTRGATDYIEFVSLNGSDLGRQFAYVHHYCRCPNCPGVKYPFRPLEVSEYDFIRMSEERRLALIRDSILEGGPRDKVDIGGVVS